MFVPEFDTSRGEEVVALAAEAGLVLDPWQAFVLEHGLGVGADGLWAAFEVGICAPRQNGKDGIFEARALAALYLFEEPLTVHSAHQFDTSLEAFRRLMWLIEDNPRFDRDVKRVSRSHGEEGIELKNGCRIRFRTRTKGGGRGFSCDCLIFNEAMFLPEMTHGALLPTLAARRNPQVWYGGSAVDQLVHDQGVVFTRVRERGVKGEDGGLAYFEWSAEGTIDDTEEIATDERAWAAANPGLGIRIARSHIELEQLSLDPRNFAVERLGIGDWPDLGAIAGQGLNLDAWLALVDTDSSIEGPVVFSFDTTPDRGMTSIYAAGNRRDGLGHVEKVEHRPGTKWVPGRLVELAKRHEHVEFICDGLSPAAALLPAIERAAKEAGVQVKVKVLSTQEYGQAFGKIVDAVNEGLLRHLGTPELTSAVRGAIKRPLGDADAWSRRRSNIDISPLVASTLALWGVEIQAGPSVYASRGVAVI